MSFFKCLCMMALLAPMTLLAVGCGGSTDSAPMATDAELEEYGANAAKGTALEGLKGQLGGGAEKAE